jgi:hypothetical protein
MDNIRMISKDMFSSEKDICNLVALHLNPNPHTNKIIKRFWALDLKVHHQGYPNTHVVKILKS